ncbi:MAG TPA: thiopurine S-methyltransferase [Verrucomicrobiales bacterium]|nr:thiopurine S-methyltransferase [Verrucomicrobiales bacterium]
MPTDWEAKYQAGETPWDKGSPSPGLVDFLAANSDMPKGRVLVPGCGAGHDVRAWAESGFDVVGLDVSPSAISKCRELSRNSPGRMNFVCDDFLNGSPEQPFDWLFEHTLYCAIDPDCRAAYLEAVHRWIKPGGFFLAVHYMIPDTDGPPFGTDRDEVVGRFAGELTLVEEWVPRSYANRTGLERMFWWRKSVSAGG